MCTAVHVRTALGQICIIDCESCTIRIRFLKTAACRSGRAGLTRGTCFILSRIKLPAIAVLRFVCSVFIPVRFQCGWNS